jgi:hypothetical protein
VADDEDVIVLTKDGGDLLEVGSAAGGCHGHEGGSAIKLRPRATTAPRQEHRTTRTGGEVNPYAARGAALSPERPLGDPRLHFVRGEVVTQKTGRS